MCAYTNIGYLLSCLTYHVNNAGWNYYTITSFNRVQYTLPEVDRSYYRCQTSH